MAQISTFLSTIGQGVKPNMFVIDIEWPQSGGVEPPQADIELTNLLCKSAALPNSTVGTIEVPFRGRTVKIAGDRTFDTWTSTFFNDKEFKSRAYFERWMEAINSHNNNTADLFLPSQTDGYMATVKVKQLEKDNSEKGRILRQYNLIHCFPASVSQIDLAYDSNDQIEEFAVEWQYSYWHAVTPQSGPADSGSKDVVGNTILIEK